MEKEIVTNYIPLELDTDDFSECKYNKTLLNKGIKDASYLVGYATALLNCGLTKEQVTEIILKELEKGIFGEKSV